MLDEILNKIRHKNKSKDIAKKRLKFALIYDKLEISDELLQELQNDIVNVISKYFEIDKSQLLLDIQKEDQQTALVLNTPIISAKFRGHGVSS
ncbi:MAG: cell division topological specificity factor MinE [Desulfobacterales bacterium]|nr:cell division topological specificity factor MinE [Desulfobacterales bacterium]